ncbi:MAG: pyridoxamine 5'-phosphate oxidase family protein [Gammaproteobacteria bacterium]|nr:pyridoxamine 5'-phosphate oxidase family protein [Gammaproteobacteria bacterium]
MDKNYTKLVFTDSVKQAQERYGARDDNAHRETSGDRYQLTEKEIAYIQSRDSFYMATVGENGWPYVQFRGGSRGFLKAIDNTTIAYADFRGNRQYISTGNILASEKAALILMDYPSQQRLKIWAETKIIEAGDDTGLLQQLQMPDYEARIERLVIFDIQAYDWNCPKHITPRYTKQEVQGLDLSG